jgi:hypothetical protein
VDEAGESELQLTLFHEGSEIMKKLKAGVEVRVAPAGVDRKPTADAVPGKISAMRTEGRQGKATVAVTPSPDTKFRPTGLFRLWIAGTTAK